MGPRRKTKSRLFPELTGRIVGMEPNPYEAPKRESPVPSDPPTTTINSIVVVAVHILVVVAIIVVVAALSLPVVIAR